MSPFNRLSVCAALQLGVVSRRSLGQPPRHVHVGRLDLAVGGAGVGELVARVGVLQVPPHPRHVGGDVVVAVLLGHHLAEQRQTSIYDWAYLPVSTTTHQTLTHYWILGMPY